MADALEVGHIAARLDALFDQSGFDRFDRSYDQTQTKAKTPVKAKLGADYDPSALDAYERRLAEVRAMTARREDFKARLGADYDSRAFRAFERDIDSARRAREKEAADAERDARRVQAANDRTRASFSELGTGIRRLYDQAGKITLIGVAAQAISALGAAGGATVAALGPLSGLLAAYPALGSAAGQALGVVHLAAGNLSEAVGGLNQRLDENSKAYKELDPQAQRLAHRLDDMKKPIRELQGVAQRGLFPGVEDAARRLDRLMPVAHDITEETAHAIGDLADQAARLLTTWGPDLETQGQRNTRWIREAGDAGLHMADALRHVTIEAGPLIDWIVKGTDHFARFVDHEAEAGRESGQLAGFFRETRREGGEVVHLLDNMAVGLFNVVKGGKPLGDEILVDLTQASREFRQWTESAEGKNAIKEYFDDARPAVHELGKLTLAVVQAFFRLGRGDQVAPLLKTVRTELLPAFEKLVDSTTGSFGPTFLDALSQALILFSRIAGSSGPLVLTAKLLDEALTAVNHLIDRFPVLGQVIVTALAVANISKALGLAGALTGVTRLIGLLKTARGLGVATAGAEVAAGAGGGAAARGAIAGGGAAAGPIGWVFAGGALLAMHGADNLSKRRTRAQSAADTVAGNLEGADPRQIDRISKAMDVLQSKVLLSDSAWERYHKTLKAVGVSEGASQQDLDAITGRFNKLRPALQRAADALRTLFGRKTRIAAGDILDPNAAEQVASVLHGLRKNGATDIDDLRERLKFNMREIRKAFVDGSAGSRAAMIDNFGAGIKAVRKGMRDGSISVKDGMKEIRSISRQQMAFTRDNLANLSDDGRRKLALNFRHAADAASDQMTRAGKVTKSGMREVRGYLSQELQLYGFSIKEAKNIAAGHSYIGGPEEGTAGHQRGGRVRRRRGGWIGGRGMVGPDDVPIGPDALAARGEFHAAGSGGYDAIINRHQAPLTEAFMRAFGGPFRNLDDLARAGSRVDQVGYLDAVLAPIGGLDSLFAAVQQPHMFAAGGRVARFAFGGVTPAIARLITRLDSMGFHHGSTTGGQHAPGSYHYEGEAVDYGDAANDMRRLWRVVFPQRGQFAELFGPNYLPQPTLMHNGVGFTDPALQAQHNNHIHMALAGANAAVSGSIAAAWKAIRAPRITGGGTVGQVVQSALGLATSAANKVGQNAADSSTGGVGASGSIGTAALRGLIARALRITGHYSPANAAGVLARVMFESGGNPRAINLTDNNARAGHPSKGLLQTIDSTFETYRLPGLPNNVYNPLANLVAGIRYMFARYGHVMGNTGVGYRTGGLLRRFAGGGWALTPGQRFEASNPLTAGAFRAKGPNRFSAMVRGALSGLGARASKIAGGLEDRYSSFEERWQADDSDFIVLGDVDHPAHVDQEKVNERIGQLNRLIGLREEIIKYLKRVEKSIEQRITIHKTAIDRLKRLIKRSHGKTRTGYRKLLKRYRSQLFDLGTQKVQAVTAVSGAKDDLTALRDERQGWRTGSTASDLIGALTPEEGGPADTSGLDLGAAPDSLGSDTPDDTTTEAAPTPEEIATAAAQQLTSFQSGLQDLYSSFGRNYRLPTAPAPGGQYETPEFFGAGSGPSDPGFGTGGRGVMVGQITNVYPTPPPDPHTWSRNLEFELGAVG